MTISEILQAGRELISNPKHWTTGAFARTDFGVSTNSRNPEATCWCSFGALKKVAGNEDTDIAWNFLNRSADSFGYDDSLRLNDDSNHTTTLAMWDRAIEMARNQEAK